MYSPGGVLESLILKGAVALSFFSRSGDNANILAAYSTGLVDFEPNDEPGDEEHDVQLDGAADPDDEGVGAKLRSLLTE